MFLTELLYLLAGFNCKAPHRLADKPGICLKNADELKALFLKIQVIYQRHAQVAGAKQNCFQAAVQPQNFADFLVQGVHVIAVPLLAKAAEAV